MISAHDAGPWMVGIQRNAYFTGRQPVLDALRSVLEANGVAALTGLGGVGKTQIATEYAYRHRGDYASVFWVNASDESMLSCSFVQIGELLGLFENHNELRMRPIEVVRARLEQSDDWLIVYDNADDPSLLKEYMPRVRTGHIIVTSRAQVLDSLGIAKPIEVAQMAPEEALRFMLRRTGREDTDVGERACAETLVEQLGCLPLALEQAAAYISGKQSRFQAYLEAYDSQCLGLLDRTRPVAGDPAKSVTTTWTIAFESLAATPVAADILAVCAFLSPDEIPLEFFQCGASELGPQISKALGCREGELRLDEALEPLSRYSLIHRNIVERTLTVHRLVQEVTRNRMEPQERRLWQQRVTRALDAVFPTAEFEEWALCKRLVPHVRRVAAALGEDLPHSLEAASLLNNAGRFLFRHGQYGEAESMHAKSLALREELLGERDLAVATSLNNLGNVYFGQGRYAESESLHERALSIRIELLGPAHCDVAASLNNVANVYHLLGKFTEAEALHRRAIALKEQILSDDDPDMALSFDNFGNLYYDQGKYSEAEPLHRRALEIREKAFGREHPFVAASLDNLAMVYRCQGKYAQAEPLHRRAAEIHEKTLGPNHHHFAESLISLANVYRNQGRLQEAEPLCLRAIAIYRESLGVHHPDTARSLNELACLYRAQGREDEANRTHRNALESAQHMLGADHPMLEQLREEYADALQSIKARDRNVLTRRERQVAGHVAEGQSNRAIADALSLSERTVESHVASILSKLNMNSRGELAAYVLREAQSVLRA